MMVSTTAALFDHTHPTSVTRFEAIITSPSDNAILRPNGHPMTSTNYPRICAKVTEKL